MRKTFLLCAATVTALVSSTACNERPVYTGALEGLTGTTASQVVNPEFHERLAATPTGSTDLTDTGFAAETYDAVVILALAAEAAGTDGVDLAREIIGITREGTECTSFVACLEVIRSGGNPAYVGAAGSRPLDDTGEPEAADYQVDTFGANDRIDINRRVLRTGTRPPTMSSTGTPITATRAGDGTLHLGALQPLTGRGTIYLSAVKAAWELAIADINAAGGVLGHPVEASVGDAGDASDDTGIKSATALLADGVDAVIASNSSAVTLQVIDQIVGAGVPMFSPLNTAPALTTYPDNGLYFRNLPSDILQAHTLATLIAERGNTSVAVIAVDDAYGRGIADQLALSLGALGVTITTTELYAGGTTDFFPIVRRVKQTDPDAIVLTSLSEGSLVLRARVVSGIGPRQKQVFGTDGTTSDEIGKLFDAGK